MTGDPFEAVSPGGEFAEIARLWRPLTLGAPEALGLMDDAAVLPSRPGFDLVITKDAVVEGVHFLPDAAPGEVAARLLRTNLSDLAAKAAEPFGYLLAIAWPHGRDAAWRAAFAAALAEDQARFGVRLFGGDTVSTPGPFTASLTALGWVPAGKMVRRGGARAGDVVLVSGTIGDAGLGLAALTQGLPGLDEAGTAALVGRHRRPEPRLDLREALRAHASAAADVSDGLLADAGHIAQASGLGLTLRLEALPLSPAATAWLARQHDGAAARLRLATAGDDYEIVCTCPPPEANAFVAMAAEAGVPLTPIGEMKQGQGLTITCAGRPLQPGRLGWTHT